MKFLKDYEAKQQELKNFVVNALIESIEILESDRHFQSS